MKFKVLNYYSPVIHKEYSLILFEDGKLRWISMPELVYVDFLDKLDLLIPNFKVNKDNFVFEPWND
jgi:hypothetical protein